MRPGSSGADSNANLNTVHPPTLRRQTTDELMAFIEGTGAGGTDEAAAVHIDKGGTAPQSTAGSKKKKAYNQTQRTVIPAGRTAGKWLTSSKRPEKKQRVEAASSPGK